MYEVSEIIPYVLKESTFEGFPSSFACTCSTEDYFKYSIEFVRVWDKFHKDDVGTFHYWKMKTNYTVIQEIINKISEFGYYVESIVKAEWSAITFVSYNEGDPKFYIQYDDLIFAFVDMYNFIEKYFPERVMEKLGVL